MTIPDKRPEKRCRTTPPASPIPEDLLLSEVLPRLPVKSLARFKAVCRSWWLAVGSPALVRRHLQLTRAEPPSILVIPRKDYHDSDVDDDDDENGSQSEEISFHRLILGKAPGTADVELMFEKAWPEGMAHGALPTHCDGLVAVATATDQIFVCNPATREFVALPPGSRDVVIDYRVPAVALGYDPQRNRYVVARYFYRRYDVSEDIVSGEFLLDHDIGHEIFVLGDGAGGGGWEPTADPPHAIGPARPICTREAFYWCTSELRPSALLRFGLRSRAFDVVPCPPGADYVHGVDHLTELAGKPCYVQPVTDTAFDFWVADDDGGPRPEWSIHCRVDFEDCSSSIGSDALLVVAAARDKMLIAADHRSVYSYDAGRKSVRQVVDMEEELAYERPDGRTFAGELMHHVVPYVESLVSIGNCNY
ncbi:hypothetical protein BS78_06G065900 [Paspalum vaginatum]|nr:hypothetical protein BS78_06G065900 [Paspalum vaginatum]